MTPNKLLTPDELKIAFEKRLDRYTEMFLNLMDVEKGECKCATVVIRPCKRCQAVAGIKGQMDRLTYLTRGEPV